jgi:magnesium chelatase accessory protein
MRQQPSIYVRCGGVRWRVLVEGSGPVLFALHGTGSSAASFQALLPTLAERFTVVAPDLPGHAFSRPEGPPVRSLPGMAGALNALLQQLGLTPSVVMGHSAGAAVIARMTLDHSVHPSLFVGLAPAIVPLPMGQHAVLSSAARLLRRSRRLRRLALLRNEAKVADLVRTMGSTLDAEGLRHYRGLAASPEHLEGVLDMLSSWDVAPVHRDLGRLRVRTLVVAGARDRAVPVEQALRLTERLPNARLVVVPGAGHLVHEEKPGEVSGLLLEALATAAPAADRTGPAKEPPLRSAHTAPAPSPSVEPSHGVSSRSLPPAEGESSCRC